MKYERLTIKRENGFTTVRNTTLQGLIDRLAELENKIERGELDYVAGSKTEQTITDLLIEFDEMGFAPTTVCPDPEKYAIEWREKVRAEIKRLKIENAALRERLDKAVELPCKVGDTVYEKGMYEGDVYEHRIRKIIFDAEKISFDCTAIGNSIFLTRTEAEARLAELKGGRG